MVHPGQFCRSLPAGRVQEINGCRHRLSFYAGAAVIELHKGAVGAAVVVFYFYGVVTALEVDLRSEIRFLVQFFDQQVILQVEAEDMISMAIELVVAICGNFYESLIDGSPVLTPVWDQCRVGAGNLTL